MSILTWPAGLAPQSMELVLETKTQTFESDLNGARQTGSLPGSRWGAVLTFSNLIGDPEKQLRGFLARLGGTLGQFYMPAFGARIPAGTAQGTPLVKGAGQTGNSLVTDGWTANQPGVLKAGDYLQVGSLFHIMTADADVDVNGEATLSIAPELRTSPADNAAVVVNSPCVVMQLVDNRQTRFAQQPGKIYAISFAVREVIDI